MEKAIGSVSHGPDLIAEKLLEVAQAKGTRRGGIGSSPGG
ncbi:hypothetical protein J2Y41_003859 [Arthrobacter sp. 1088]|nr:hypothetical protein [Arthrobacter sp. 1088]